MKFLEGLQTFIVEVDSLVNKTKVVNGFNAVSFYTDSLKEEFLGSVVVFLVIKTISFVDKCLGVITIVLNCQVSKLFCALKVVLEEVQE